MADEGYDYDLFVIGCGSGGMRATRFAKKHFGVAKVGTCDMPFSQLSVEGRRARPHPACCMVMPWTKLTGARRACVVQ